MVLSLHYWQWSVKISQKTNKHLNILWNISKELYYLWYQRKKNSDLATFESHCGIFDTAEDLKDWVSYGVTWLAAEWSCRSHHTHAHYHITVILDYHITVICGRPVSEAESACVLQDFAGFPTLRKKYRQKWLEEEGRNRECVCCSRLCWPYHTEEEMERND